MADKHKETRPMDVDFARQSRHTGRIEVATLDIYEICRKGLYLIHQTARHMAAQIVGLDADELAFPFENFLNVIVSAFMRQQEHICGGSITLCFVARGAVQGHKITKVKRGAALPLCEARMIFNQTQSDFSACDHNSTVRALVPVQYPFLNIAQHGAGHAPKKLAPREAKMLAVPMNYLGTITTISPCLGLFAN